MKILLLFYLSIYSSFCFSDNVKLHLARYLNDDTGKFTLMDNWEDGTYLMGLGIELNIDNAKAIFITDINANEAFCLRPDPYYQLIYMRAATVFNRGNLYVKVARPCPDKNQNVNLKLTVLDKNKNKYTDTLRFKFDSSYGVN